MSFQSTGRSHLNFNSFEKLEIEAISRFISSEDELKICSDEQGTARGGCDDGFGVFGFLAFLLALLDLLLELGDDGRSRHNNHDTNEVRPQEKITGLFGYFPQMSDFPFWEPLPNNPVFFLRGRS